MSDNKKDNKTSDTPRKTRGGPSDIDRYVGKRLKIRRNLLGWSQEELASKIGITFQQIQKYEHGTNRISAGKLFEFAQVLKTSITFFFEGADTSGQTTSKSYAVSDDGQAGFSSVQTDLAKNEEISAGLPMDILEKRETTEIIQAYYAIDDPQVRDRLLQFIKSVAQSSANGHVQF